MYRISRFFVSDIAPGQNILRNGSFRIAKKGGEAAHGVLFAANGTCKTTLLSFLLTVFCPERRRFVQHLQSGGDKTMDQYLIPGRPAVVLLDLVRTLEPDLFKEQPEEHLVIGQLLYRHKSAADKVDRIFFMADNPLHLFDELPEKWDQLLEQDRPFTAVRDFMNTRVKKTTSQKEWEDVLERNGLDPWLMQHQVDFARSEGGVKDAFKFRSESDFLAFFLGCVSDMDSAIKLYENTAQSIKKMQDRPEKNARLAAANTLKKLMEEFDGTAKNWRAASGTVASSKLELGEAAHLLKKAKELAEIKEAESARAVEETRKLHGRSSLDMKIAGASVVKVTETFLLRKIEQTREKLAATTAIIHRATAERDALKASEMIAKIRKHDAEIETREESLQKADAELAPKRRMLDLRAAQYHTRHQAEQRHLEGLITDNETTTKEKDEILVAAGADLSRLRKELAALDKEITVLATRMESAIEAKGELLLEPGEVPRHAGKRLMVEIEEAKTLLSETETSLKKMEDKLADAHRQWKDLQQESAKKEAELGRARDTLSGEAAEREALLSDINLQALAGTATFEPTGASLAAKLDDQITRSAEKRDQVQAQLSDLKSELRNIEGIEALSVDSRTKRLIDYYIGQGIAKSDIRPFPEYLSSMYEDPEDIASFLERDPGRFTGILAAREEVIEKVMAMAAPQFLHKPVVISTPCVIEEVTAIDYHVISPNDPKVYSRSYLEQEKATLRKQVGRLEENIQERSGRIKSLAASQQRLNAYRERFPDRAAVDALTSSVETLQKESEKITARIHEYETFQAKQAGQKRELENKIGEIKGRLGELSQALAQVASWLRQYGELDRWQDEKAAKEPQRVERAGAVDSAEKALNSLAAEIAALKEENVEIRGRRKALMERADDVSSGVSLTLETCEREQALKMPLSELRAQHEAARETMRKAATDLGIGEISEELERLKGRRQGVKTELQEYGQSVDYDSTMADDWASKTRRQRTEHGSSLEARLSESVEKRGLYTGKMESGKEELKKNTRLLAGKAAKGIHPDVPAELLAAEDLDALGVRYRNEEEKHKKECSRLTERLDGMGEKLAALRQWCNRIAVAKASVKSYDPHWDDHSPRLDWPPLTGTEELMANATSFQAIVDRSIKAAGLASKNEAATKKVMNTGFEILQRNLRDEAPARLLPAIVDELRRHDVESLGVQSSDFIEKCGDIAANIESDLARSKQFIESLVDMLLQQTKEYHQKLQAAAREVVPDNVFIYGKKPILLAGTRLDFTRHDEAFRGSIDHWLDELIQQNRVPEVNPAAGNVLGAELLVRLLRAATGKKEFGIRLLKCDDSGKSYEPVGKDLGSGGEALTTAVLLYSLLTSMRQKRHGKSEGIPAFLILDNPLGVCNRSDFLDAQLKVAWAMGIQCVYLTGINDRESIGLFEHRVAIRKGERQLEIGGKSYNSLEIIEQNLERAS